MKTIYVYSYYQTPGINVPNFRPEISEFMKKILIDGVVQVSTENLNALYRTIIEACSYDDDESQYLTLLHCDIEVAIQEEKIRDMATRFGFNFELVISSKPIFNWVDVYSTCVQLDNIYSDDVYVINTHGRRQELDGSYHQAVYNEYSSLKRIVVDACSSASGGFPVIKSGNRSIIECVADEIIGKDRLLTSKLPNERMRYLEIVGYNGKFDPITNEELSATAIFGATEAIVSSSALTLLTPDERLKAHNEYQINKYQNAYSSKLREYMRLSQKDSPLEPAMMEVSSRLLNYAFHHRDETPAEMLTFLYEMVKDPKISFEGFKTEIAQSTQKARKLNDFKKTKNNYLKGLKDPQKKMQLASKILEFAQTLKSETDFNENIATDILCILTQNSTQKSCGNPGGTPQAFFHNAVGSHELKKRPQSRSFDFHEIGQYKI